jgi:acetoin utilization deacetylase AcuC-like enzyme
MKVIFSEDFYQVYTGDPAAAPGRIESVFKTIESHVAFVTAKQANRQNIAAVHSSMHIQHIESHSRISYLQEVEGAMKNCRADLIGISAGFDNHAADWGGLLATEDYKEIGRLVRWAANRNEGGCFGILEGGYNHTVLGENVLALIQGMADES